MARGDFVKRHRMGIASGVAMLLAASAVVSLALDAEGYKRHEAQLNDGGIWVVHGAKGIHGRLNKPIDQLDGVVPEERDKIRLDVVQDGAAVLAINETSRQGRVIDPRRLVFADSGTAALPEDGDVQLAGGTLAAVERASGKLWATRVDPETGQLLVTEVDRQADELTKVGADASLAVTLAGTVVAVSGKDQVLTTVPASDAELGEPTEDALPDEAGTPDAVTAVGERVVTLDSGSGRLSVVDGGSADVPKRSVLQHAGPSADAVLVGAPDGLLSVDLESGETTVVAEASGRAVEPVRLGSCVYGAWSGGLGALATQCGDLPAEIKPVGGRATDLAFRVNRGEIVLNDSATGAVWDVDLQTPIKTNWNDFTSKKQKQDEDKQDNESNQADRRPPLAKPDSYGVRPGRTTVLHPLDNDSAPEGRLLSIVGVAQPAVGSAEISPDGQSIVLSTPERARPVAFDYFINDGRSNVEAQATIDVSVRDTAQNQPPAPRKGYEPRVYRVPARGSLSVPVLGDWRDDQDGDTLLLESAKPVGQTAGGAATRTTADGRIRFTAPQGREVGAQNITVEYAVTDGRSAPVNRRLEFAVQAPSDQRSFPATAEPDVVRGEVGTPIKIRPLLNDLPGSDPATPNAELALGGRIPRQAGATITTDREHGVITFETQKAGTYFLDYDAAFGNAPLERGTIRVDVRARGQRSKDPVAMPDTLTLYGQSAGLVDVLANDLDPSGGLLVVQQATASTADQLDVAIVEGRWLRISARQPEMAPRIQRIGYLISNGTRSGIRGEVVVTQRPEPRDNTPMTVTDRVVVRAGSSITAPVLDNDISPSGDRLTLVTDQADGTPGELPVTAPADVKGDSGKAYVSGRLVRFVAPSRLQERDTYEVSYVATNASGATAPGRLLVTVVPLNEKNTAPEPPVLEGRVVSGDTVKVKLPGSGVDAEGDPVTVTGITSAPRLGRIVATGGNFIAYQAYPRGGAGTDTFSFAVVDSQGAVGTGTARVAVVAAGAPQPPLAVADSLMVEPGRTATFDPLSNDFIAPGDEVEISLVDPPAGARLDPESKLVTVPAPDRVDAPAVTVVYELDNGLDQARSTMTLEPVADYNNPPVVYDAFGRAEDSGSVVVDVLEGAYDPDGDVDDLEVTDVHAEPTATVNDGRVRVERAEWPKVVPFRVEDGDGAASTASLYVPPTGDGLPYVDPDALIELDSGRSVSGRLSDFIITPEGAPLRLTGASALSTSPVNGLSAQTRGQDGFTLTSTQGFGGPGALLVEVTTAADASGNEDVSDPTDGFTLTLSIPVQVGDPAPILTCPSATIPITAGESQQLDLTSYCEVWTLDPADAAGLAFAASWVNEVAGVSLADVSGAAVRVQAADDATGGGNAVLQVRAGDSNAQQITFRLSTAPPPRMLPIRTGELRAGESRTLDLAPYLQSEVADPRPTVVSVQTASGSRVRATASGSRVTVTAAAQASGEVSFRVIMSDVSSADPPAGRRAEGRIAFRVGGTPGAPSEPRVIDNSAPNKIRLSWLPPSDDGGAQVTHYEVREERGRIRQQRCRTTTCDIGGVNSDRRYYFRVRAVNKVGPGEWSDLSREAVAIIKPTRVDNIKMTGRGDGQITLGWDPPPGQASRILRYWVGWPGQDPLPVSATSYTAMGLDNNRTYVFSIRAESKGGLSEPRSSAALQSVGTPAPPASVTVADLNSGAERTTLQASWPATLPNGPAPVTYTVYVSRNGGSPTGVAGCSRIQATVCNHSGLDYNGDSYAYSVRAFNGPGVASPAVAAAAHELVGRPAAWGAWTAAPTGQNQQLRVTATAPDPRGAEGRVAIIVAGQVVRELNVRAGQSINELVPTQTNDEASTVQVRLCNENASRGGVCATDAKTVQSYGPLGGRLVKPAVERVDGKNITWRISGTANGDVALVDVEVDGSGTRLYTENARVVGPGQFSFLITVASLDYTDTQYIIARLYDNDPGGRGDSRDGAQAPAGEPPPPVVWAYKQGECTDGDDNPDNNCAQLPGQPVCDSPACGYVHYQVEGFVRDYTCSVRNSEYSTRWWGVDYDHPANQRADQQTSWYYDKGYVTVTCSSGSGKNGQTASGGFTWP